MPLKPTGFSQVWKLFSAKEKRNILVYIIGIMLYKFGLEAFNGAVVTLATNRYDQDAYEAQTPARTFERIGLLSGLNQAFQCVGSILIAPLIKRWPIRTILSISIVVFAIFTASLMIIDAATGGYIKPANFTPKHANDFSYYGHYNTDLIIPIYCFTGIVYGMVELIRRIIPRDIVGGDVEKLQRMDSVVHIFYEVSGTAGAFATALGLIPRLGNNYAFIITPICFTACGVIWFFLSSLKSSHPSEKEDLNNDKSSYIKSILDKFLLFGKSVYIGGKIIFTKRRFIWLWSGYSVALYSHRYLENGIAPQVAKRYMENSAWSQIIVGGSNFGELIGAFTVFLFANTVRTPMPWLRLDAILLMIVWYIPFFYPTINEVKYAWMMAATFIPISFGWAAGDVSLGAYIQSSLTNVESNDNHISPLGAVMAFLYSSYIILYAIANPLLGIYIDSVYNAQKTIRPALIYTGGVQFTMVSIMVFASTFIPRGSIAFNPKMLSKYPSDKEHIADEKMDDFNSVENSSHGHPPVHDIFDLDTYF
ncbi:unnamed protein product [Rotaria magnacalcarata]|uniref:Uncharacterized protein n=1 Tax=Rotaria magnacalcarata TaxID=392030 RepID=A0A815BWN0_9BILA|nr:unnamed protein product [Rotaria magnacalcarata]CAF4337052.1 unnamed protein product [Rotaria magnacalcarata]